MTTVREIVFEQSNNPKVCYSGQLLKGKANIYFPVDTHVREIYITFVGIGFCQWTEGSNCKTASKTYLDKRLDLLRSSDADIVVPAGNHHYPFEIELHVRLPTSYEGTYGYIRYTATLDIDGTARKVDPLKEIFTIVKPLNLNNDISYRTPMEVRKFTKFNQCCLFFCWLTSDMKIFGRLPVSGYCPGQTMNLKLDVINESAKEILHFLVHFIKEVTYNSKDGSKKIQKISLAERQTEGCRADRSGIQSIRVNILVPSLPPTNFAGDSICGCRYMFRVTAATEFCHHDPTFEIPVIIGTYPISNEVYASMSDGSSDVNRSKDFIVTTAPELEEYYENLSNSTLKSCELPPYPDTDPPTYEEALTNGDTSTGKESFLPKYPTYRRGTIYSSEES